MRKQMVLGLALDAAGHHPAAWRLADFPAGAGVDAGRFLEIARLAETAKLDFLLAGYPLHSSALVAPAISQAVQLEPLSLIAAMLPHVRQIGLAALVPMAYWEPFNTARAFAALDNLSAGRSAWLAVPESGPEDAANFPRFAHQNIQAPYERAAEYMGLVRALWDSWEDDALKFDKVHAIFTDRNKVHRVEHKGQYFTCDGPLNAPRPPQGHPPVLITGASPEDVAFAAAHADILLLRQVATVRPAAPWVLLDLHFVLGGSDQEANARAAELDALMPPAPDAGPRFVGTATGLVDFMTGLFASGDCDGFTLMPAVMPRDLALFADQVVPLLRAKGLFRVGYQGSTLRDHLGLARPVIAGAA